MQCLSLIDFDNLTSEEINACARLVDDIRKANIKASRWRDLLDHGTDEDIVTAARDAHYNPAGEVPITLANRYIRVDPIQEMWGVHKLGEHPRRPVYLKGSKNVRIYNHKLSSNGSVSPNGWASLVMARAIRMSKATFLEQDEYEDFRGKIQGKLHSRYHLTSKFRCLSYKVRGGYTPNMVLIKGRFHDLTPSEIDNLKVLYSIIKRTDKLDERRAMMKAHISKRMAV
jgi:hypothetical protein